MTKFQAFYDNVRQKDALPIRVEIEKLVASQSFRNWANGIFEPDSSWWSRLNAIAEQFGYPKPYIL